MDPVRADNPGGGFGTVKPGVFPDTSRAEELSARSGLHLTWVWGSGLGISPFSSCGNVSCAVKE